MGVAALALLASGCGRAPAPAPPPPVGAAEQPGTAGPDFGPVQVEPETRKMLAEAAIYRSWDPCALHDPAAAAKVFGDVSLIEPSDLNSCFLQVKIDRDGIRSWRTYTRIGSPYSEERDLAGATVVEAAGRKFYGKKGEASSIGSSCAFTMPTSKTQGIRLDVNWSASSTDTPPKQPCDAAKEYITAIAPYWANPLLRIENATEPMLVLATKDPCASVKDLAEKFKAQIGPGEQPMVAGSFVGGAHSCTLVLTLKVDKAKKRRPDISIKFNWFIDPATQNTGASGPVRMVQIEGKPAMVEDRSGRSIGDCLVRVQYDPTAVPGVDGKVQVIDVSASDCQTAEEAAKIVTKAAA